MSRLERLAERPKVTADQLLIACIVLAIVSVAGLALSILSLKTSVNVAADRAADRAAAVATANSLRAIHNSQCDQWRFQAGAVRLPSGDPQPQPATDLGAFNRLYAQSKYKELTCLPTLDTVPPTKVVGP